MPLCPRGQSSVFSEVFRPLGPVGGLRDSPERGPSNLVRVPGDDVVVLNAFDMSFDDVESVIRHYQPDFLGATAISEQRMCAINVLYIANRYGITTIGGGPHATIMAEQLIDSYTFID